MSTNQNKTKIHRPMKRTKFRFNYKDLKRSEKIKLTKIERDVQNLVIEQKKTTYEIGKLLHHAKRIVPHGCFQDWIKQTFADDLPYSTAYFYMRVYETFENQPGMVSRVPSQYLLTLTQKKFPEQALQIIKEKLDNQPDSIEKWQMDEIKEFFGLMKKGTVGGNAFLKQVREIIKDGQALQEDKMNRAKHRMNRNARRSLYFGLGDILNRLDAAVEQARQMAGLFPFDPEDPEHRQVITKIDRIVEKLQKLEKQLQGGEGLLKPVSTENGEQYL